MMKLINLLVKPDVLAGYSSTRRNPNQYCINIDFNSSNILSVVTERCNTKEVATCWIHTQNK